MKKFVVALVFAALLSCVQVNAAEPLHETFKHKGLEREYFLYLPDGMKEDAPLVIVLHGYGTQQSLSSGLGSFCRHSTSEQLSLSHCRHIIPRPDLHQSAYHEADQSEHRGSFITLQKPMQEFGEA